MSSLRFIWRPQIALWFLILSCAGSIAAPAVLQMRNGYLWDPQTQDYFIARGIAYQLWNPPVGANQSFEQLTYDLTEFKKNYMNSVRCEMVWGELETAPGVYDWRKPDYLVAEAERLGLKLFVLIGFQYPPAWFAKDLHAINSIGLTPSVMQALAASTPANALNCFPAQTQDLIQTAVPAGNISTVQNALVNGAKSGSIPTVLSMLEAQLPSQVYTDLSRLLISDVINFEHPDARSAYAAHMAAVTGRYKNSTAIGGWIMGNEYAYFDLWEDPAVFNVHRFLGFDSVSQQSFQSYLTTLYGTIGALNQNWGTSYASFSAVVMPATYPLNRDSAAYFDLIQWRKKSIGDFVAVGAAAARQADPNHLQSYSMVGGVFSGRDANYGCEDAHTIVARCKAAGAPLDFWSINNYANASLGSELRSGDFGIAKYQEESGLPVMISETGHSSTEDLFDYPNSGLRQAKALPGQIWESVISGVIGTHIFHWNDRSQFTQGYFLRERGFGIVGQNRAIKPEVYTNTMRMFRRMSEIRLENLLGASTNPPVNVQFFWSTNSDLVWSRANQENAMTWGILRRLGYQPGIIADAAFEAGAWSNAPALLLSRNYQMKPQHLADIANRVIPAGIHVHANADIPGQTDAYSHVNPNWNSLMSSIFGISTATAVRGLHGMVTNETFGSLEFQGATALGALPANYNAKVVTWEIWHGVGVTDGTVVVRDTGLNATQSPLPALVTKSHGAGAGKAAINTFALGDTAPNGGTKESIWDLRSQWLSAVYGTYFGMTPAIRLSGPGSTYVLPDYRICRNGSILISLLNEGTNNASVTMTAPTLLQGKTVENITQGGIVERNSDGVVSFNMTGDDYFLLYIYSDTGSQTSLIQNGISRVWFETAPVVVHPRTATYPVSIGFDTEGTSLQAQLNFETVDGRIISTSSASSVTGKGQKQLDISIPDADLDNPGYLSTSDGGSYILHATLSSGAGVLSDTRAPVRLSWAVRPTAALPATPTPGASYTNHLEWEDLPAPDPADPTPFDRALIWDSINTTNHAYAIVLNLLGSGGVVASSQLVTRYGTGSADFALTVPQNASGPLTWSAEARPVTSMLTHDVSESFEGRDRGAMWPSNLTTSYVAPWVSFKYASSSAQDIWQNEGVQLLGSDGSQSAFLVITNPPGLTFSGFGFAYPFPEAPWALPSDRSQWSKYSFSFDFHEDHSYPCQLQMQVKNNDPNGLGKWLQYATDYTPGPDGWAHVSATLDQFNAPAIFDPTQVMEIVLVAAMQKPSVQYVGSFDNIQFDGPDTGVTLGAPVGTYFRANDSAGFLKIEVTPTKNLKVSWTGTGALESASKVDGPWAPASGVTNGQEQSMPTTPKFYRLKR